MHSLSHNLFDYICDQDGRVLVTLQAPYKKELEAKYSQKYPGCLIYYEKKIRHTKLWRNQTLLLKLENIIVVDHLGRRHKSIILPDFILPYTRYTVPFFTIMLANLFDKKIQDNLIKSDNLAMYFIEFIEQLKMHPEALNVRNLDDKHKNTIYMQMRYYLNGRIKQVRQHIYELKANFISLGKNNLQYAEHYPAFVIMGISIRFISDRLLRNLYQYISATLIKASFNLFFPTFVNHYKSINKIQALQEVMQMF
ncbi:Uncharacterised protein [Anaerobiospirillum thomasii]|nr:Uncharacterised protein [Anaerobiospirillum thomasii]SPT71109.1 Uncharacterised protein [Anaerobiospirillum thomasii]SPT72199.1 Uncharacterised protein [Anaerobiospirillum thomasii]